MALDDEVLAFLENLRQADARPLEALTPPQAREAAAARADLAGEPGPVASAKWASIQALGEPGVFLPARVYQPDREASRPVVVYYHEGGWIIGDTTGVDPTCRELSAQIGATVVSVEYRLAPEHKFPIPLNDALAALYWAAGDAERLGGDGRLVVAADSAGGNLAAAVTLRARDEGGPAIAHQLLLYPVTDYDFTTASYRDNGEGYFLTEHVMRWFWAHYLPSEADGANQHASVLRASDLSGLPGATVVTAEFDPLRDEGEAYARKLTEAGVPTTLRRYDGTIHAFCTLLGALATGRTALQESPTPVVESLEATGSEAAAGYEKAGRPRPGGQAVPRSSGARSGHSAVAWWMARTVSTVSASSARLSSR